MKKKTKRETKQIVEVHIYIHQNQPNYSIPGISYPGTIGGAIQSKPCTDNLPGCLVAHC